MKLPREYIGYKFLQLSPYSNFNRDSDKYVGCCPICREGSSFGKKKRCAYLPSFNRISCLNCNNSYTPLEWILKVSGFDYSELIKDYKDFCDGGSVECLFVPEVKETVKVPDLPINEINLFDQNQLSYYENNKIVKLALEFLKARKLDIAVNKPLKYFISLDDRLHKNRLIIPFYNENNVVLNYQTRDLMNSGIRYLTKIGGSSCLFNYNNIDRDYDYIFLFEGPFDSTFIKNGVAIGGIQENNNKLFKGVQHEQIKSYPFHKKIWVLDSQHQDRAAYNKSIRLLQNNESVFIWPRKIGQMCKDFNDIAVLGYMQHITPEWIIKNTFTGGEGVLKLKKYNISF